MALKTCTVFPSVSYIISPRNVPSGEFSLKKNRRQLSLRSVFKVTITVTNHGDTNKDVRDLQSAGQHSGTAATIKDAAAKPTNS